MVFIAILVTIPVSIVMYLRLVETSLVLEACLRGDVNKEVLDNLCNRGICCTAMNEE